MKKINIWEFTRRALKGDYVETDNGRALLNPHLHSVYYDSEDKVAVATDNFKIIISKEAYKEELAGKMVMKNGTEIDRRYPKYKTVIPAVQQPYFVNLQSLSDAISKAKAMNEEYGICLIRLNQTCFQPRQAEFVYRYMMQHKVDVLLFNQLRPTVGVVCVESVDGLLAVMPSVMYDIPVLDVQVELKTNMDCVPTWKL